MLPPRLALAAVFVAFVTHAPAAVLRVPQGFTTIQAAIDAAIDGDTILVADGAYSGPGNRDMSFFGKRLIVRSENGAANCSIACSEELSDHRGFIIDSGEPAGTAIIGFTIIGGRANSGGAILCNSSDLLIAECVFRYNRALEDGGAVCIAGFGDVLIRDCLFELNTTSLGGCFTRHCCGNGIGGAIALLETNAVVTRCVIAGNLSIGSGGGIGVSPFGDNTPPPSFFSPTITNCLFARNVARAGDGGGAACYGGTPVFRNCTFASNFSACPGGGLAAVFEVIPIVRNSVFYFNDGGFNGDQFTSELGAVLDVNECNVQGGPTGVLVDSFSQLTWGPSNLDADPLFGALPNWGEDGAWATPDDFPGDLRLMPASPSIDAISGAFVPPPGETDLLGRTRMWDGDGDGTATVDHGAYEFDSPTQGDTDGDCDVDLQDLATLLASFGMTGNAAFENGDFDADGDVDLQDLATLLANFGSACV